MQPMAWRFAARSAGAQCRAMQRAAGRRRTFAVFPGPSPGGIFSRLPSTMSAMTDPVAALRAGLRDRYAFERELGRGGMATVWLAQDLRHDRPVALKLLHLHLAASLGPERFQREIRLAARLQHPHILTVLDSGETDGRLWFSSGAEFPPVPDFEGQPDFELSGGHLRQLVNQTLFAAAKESTRYAFNGVLVTAKGKKITLVATDGRRCSPVVYAFTWNSGPASTRARTGAAAPSVAATAIARQVMGEP